MRSNHLFEFFWGGGGGEERVRVFVSLTCERGEGEETQELKRSSSHDRRASVQPHSETEEEKGVNRMMSRA